MPNAISEQIETALPYSASFVHQSFIDAIEPYAGTGALELHVVAGPGDIPEGGVLPEDVLVRVAPGEPVAPLVGRVISEAALSLAGELADAELGPPGYYARVAPLGKQSWTPGSRYRRVLDPRGRVVSNTLLFRPAYRRRVYRRRPLRPVVFSSPPVRPVAFYPLPYPPAYVPGPSPAAPPPPAYPMVQPDEPAPPIYGSEPMEPGFEEPHEPDDLLAFDPGVEEKVLHSAGAAPLPSALRGRIAAIAVREWERWGRGSRSESDPNMRETLRAYWLAVRDERGAEEALAANLAWSAAFVSWVVREAGAAQAFSYSGLHVAYVAAAKRSRLNGDATKFWAYDIREAKPEVGDLVCRDRERNGVCSGTTYANVDDGTQRLTHSDVVIRVEPGRITCVGGNLEDSVRQRRYQLDAEGFVIPAQGAGCPFFAIVKPTVGS
jgi:hypothetical protein